MVDKDVVMTLLVPAKMLCNMWSYNFYDMTLFTAMSYDKYLSYFYTINMSLVLLEAPYQYNVAGTQQ